MAIILIGMPGSGKSTIARELSELTHAPMIDTDELIIQRECKPLKELLGENFRDIETAAVKSIDKDFNGIVATGGSVVYSEEAMHHLANMGTIIYLKVTLDELNERVKNFSERGIVIKDGQTFEDLYNERCPLYETYADIQTRNKFLDITVENLITFID